MKKIIVFCLFIHSIGSSLASGEDLKHQEKISIHQLTLEEWNVWKQLWLQAVEETPSYFGTTYEEEVIKSDEHWKQRCLEQMLFVASYEDTSAGCVGFYPSDRGEEGFVGWFFGMYVVPRYRKKEVAKALLKNVIQCTRERNMKRLSGLVAVENSVAIEFYKKCGFGFLTCPDSHYYMLFMEVGE